MLSYSFIKSIVVSLRHVGCLVKIGGGGVPRSIPRDSCFVLSKSRARSSNDSTSFLLALEMIHHNTKSIIYSTYSYSDTTHHQHRYIARRCALESTPQHRVPQQHRNRHTHHQQRAQSINPSFGKAMMESIKICHYCARGLNLENPWLQSIERQGKDVCAAAHVAVKLMYGWLGARYRHY